MLATLTLAALSTTLASTPCEGLKAIELPGVTITTAELVPEAPQEGRGGRGGRGDDARAGGARDGGAQTAAPAPQRGGGRRGEPPPGGRGRGRGAPAPSLVPAHCRIVAVLRPSSDSLINMEVWLPEPKAWNGKFQMTGNGGWGGSIQGLEGAMPDALRLGYATAGHDTGHRGGGAFALGHPEKVIDFAYRAVHEATVHAKSIVHAYFDRKLTLSYFNACSGGGRQALMEAQRYPEDFDGIIAGAPANPHIDLHAGDLARASDIYKDPEGFINEAQQARLAVAVMDACDGIDGLKDRLISNPMACRFDPAVLACKPGEAGTCLTPKQVATVRRNYAPAKTSTGEIVFPGLSFGVERNPTMMRGGTSPGALQADTFRYLAHQDRDWDWKTFNLDTDRALAKKNAGFIDALEFDLSRFKARGGTLLMYHGWADPAIAPEGSVNYYSSVIAKMGPGQESWLRLFMVPGMGHCGRGEGPTDVNWIAALERWREQGRSPDSIVGSGVSAAGARMTRPVCAYPKVATYKGSGSVNDAGSFVCK